MQISSIYHFILGIDVSKLTLDLCLLNRRTGSSTPFQVANNTEGFEQLGQWLGEEGVAADKVILCSEHTGRYGEHLLDWSAQNGWPHAVLKTTALQKVAPEHHRKSDAYDARKIAEYGHRFSDTLRLWRPSSPTVKQLGRLQAERRAMVKQRATLKQKRREADYHDACMKQLKDCWEQQIQLISTHIHQLEQRIKELIEENEYLNHTNTLMRTAPGMGPVLGCLWLTLFAGQEELNPRKISSRFGFAPYAYNSGTSVHKAARSSGFGKSEMRKVIHQAAQSVVKNYPHYRHYYQRKKAEGKPHLLVINNIINKLIRLYCAMWNKQQAYDAGRLQERAEARKKSA